MYSRQEKLLTERTEAAREKREKLELIARAAILWVYDQGCPNALADLEEKVVEYTGREIGDAP